MAILITLCTRTSIPKAPKQQECMASLKCTRIEDPNLLRPFAPSCLLLEHTIITWPNIFVSFYRRTFQLNIVLLTLSRLYRTSNLYPWLVNVWPLLTRKVSLPNIPLEECIDLEVNYLYKRNPDLKLSEPEIRSLFTVATTQIHFLFNGSY